MVEQMKVEFEISAFGEEILNDYESSFKKNEIGRIKNFSKETTLANIEEILKGLFAEMRSTYDQPPHMAGKVTVRVKMENGQIKFLG
ncbi:hypothetical protein [Metabacillus fastidiosus]|uniref:hypothetical protein n=1 Tax=Metabacillus fastidiosus TaxID=1458 RepID=UPI003D26D2E8